MSLFGVPQTDAGNDSPINTPVSPSLPVNSTSAKNPPPATVIAGGVRLEGEFKSQGDVQIEGEVVGTLETNATLSVGIDAKVKAGVKAENAVIAGEVIGNISVIHRLELKATAKIVGEITCATIVVDAGATIDGNLKCGTKKEQNLSTKQEVSVSKVDNSGKPVSSDAKLS